MREINKKIEYEIKVHSKELAKNYKEAIEYPGSKIFHQYWNSELIRLAKLRSNMSVLDLGCGTGILLEDLKRFSVNTFGLDVSFDMARMAKKNVVVGISENLPFRDGSFDVVICRGSIHHFFSFEQGLDEIKRVLKKEGNLVISEPFYNLLLAIPRYMAKIAKPKRFRKHEVIIRGKFFDYLKKIRFEVKGLDYFSYFAMPILYSPDIFFLFKHIASSRLLSKFLIAIDKVISRIPLVNRFSWHINSRISKSYL